MYTPAGVGGVSEVGDDGGRGAAYPDRVRDRMGAQRKQCTPRVESAPGVQSNEPKRPTEKCRWDPFRSVFLEGSTSRGLIDVHVTHCQKLCGTLVPTLGRGN